MSNGYFEKLTPEEQSSLRNWWDNESDRADARADSWIEHGLRLVLILNAGGLLSLITAAGSLINDNKKLDALMPSANLFTLGLILAAIGVVGCTLFFNFFSKWTNDMYRKIVNNEVLKTGEDKEDAFVSKIHTAFQTLTIFCITLSVTVFSIGAYFSIQAINEITAL